MNIALVSHDGRKQEMIEWVTFNAARLMQHTLFATGTTGRLIREALQNIDLKNNVTRPASYYVEKVTCLLSGPLGGDQEIGAMIAEGRIDCLIFFCDNLITQGHQQDVSALTRLAALYNIAFATNRTTADMIMTSPLFGNENYHRIIPGVIEKYKNRKLDSE